jgi:serine/threonine protein kinase
VTHCDEVKIDSLGKYELIKPSLKSIDFYQSTSGHTPTTITPRMIKIKPCVYQALDKRGKKVLIKFVPSSMQEALRIETKAMRRLKYYNFIPKLIKNVTYDKEKRQSFFVCEYIDDPWVNLTKLMFFKNAPSIEEKHFLILYETLRSTILKMHFLNVIHGDLKPEHIFVLTKNGNPDFSKIKIIDFGLSYPKFGINKWRGGTSGYMNPNNSGEYDLLSVDNKRRLDYYGVHSIIYACFTGKSFTIASSSYTRIQRNNPYFWNQVKEHEHQKNWQAPGFIKYETVENLCAPDNVQLTKLKNISKRR